MNRSIAIRGLCALAIFSLPSCGPATPTPAPGAPIHVEYTSAAQPWLSELSSCAGNTSFTVERRSPDYFSPEADVRLRLGEPESLTTPAVRIDTSDILVVVHPETGVGSLSLDQVRGLFTGAIGNWRDAGGSDAAVVVWVFAQGEDVERIFEAAVLAGAPVSSRARLAAGAQEMSDSVGATPGSVGILPRRWKTGNTREARIAASVPVLAIARADSPAPVLQLLVCLQK